MKIEVVKQFTDIPGARYRNEGEHSGQEFREDLLEPMFEEAIEKNETLLVDLDGGYGYATSFLEEAFGGLARKYGAEAVLQTIEIKTDDEPGLKEEIIDYIRNAK